VSGSPPVWWSFGGEVVAHDVVGETPNLAARLQAFAEPDTVVIAASTRRLTGGLFDYEDLGVFDIKGLAVPVSASRVLLDRGAASRFEALRESRTPLVGRDEELALLHRRWQQAKSGEGCVVLIWGEPGIGKSRLTQTLVERLAGDQHTRLRLYCSPRHPDSTLYPTIVELKRAAGFRRTDTAAQRLDKLEAMLAQVTNDLAKTAPLLAALLSLPTGERYSPLDLTPQKQKEKTLQALVAQVAGLAARQPVLMVFEDAHWSDPTSLELAARRRIGTAGRRRIGLPARHAARRGLHRQARAGAGRRLQHLAAQPPAATPCRISQQSSKAIPEAAHDASRISRRATRLNAPCLRMAAASA
jgi:hypothetical protein